MLACRGPAPTRAAGKPTLTLSRPWGVVFPVMASRPLEEYYTAAATSFIAFARKIDDEDWSRPVPCAPQWTVRDVLSHVAGVADDALQGRLVGVGTSAWSASQVERHADSTIDELLARWEEQIEPFATLVVETGSFDPYLRVTGKAADGRAVQITLARGKKFPTEDKDLQALAKAAGESLSDRLAVESLARGYLRCEQFNSDGKFLGVTTHRIADLRDKKKKKVQIILPLPPNRNLARVTLTY